MANRKLPPVSAVKESLVRHIDDVKEKYFPSATREGNCWRCGDIYGGPGKSFSMIISGESAGVWSDFSTGENGDVISYLEKREGSMSAAMDSARDIIGEALQEKPIRKSKSAERVGQVIITPIPESAGSPLNLKWRKDGSEHTITSLYPWYNLDKQIVHYTARLSDGKTKGIPIVYSSNGSWTGFVWKGPKTPVLYNLHLYDEKKPILIVEGEKCADVATKMVGDEYWVTTWQYGGANVDKTDWTVCKGARVYIWPDNDATGKKAEETLCRILGPNAELFIVQIPDAMPEGWDVADAVEKNGWDKDLVLGLLSEAQPFLQKAPESAEKPDDGLPFVCLGYDSDGGYHYMPRSTEVPFHVDAQGHKKSLLLKIAPLSFWRERFAKKYGFDMDAAVDWLFRMAEERGMYNPQALWGIGAWSVNKTAVVNTGEDIFVNGMVRRISDYNNAAGTQFTKDSGEGFNRRSFIAPHRVPRLQEAEAASIIEVLGKYKWSCRASVWLVAGWLALAPICGALPWRPHIWVTGQKGTGKSKLFERVLAPLLNGWCLYREGKVTEPAIRREMRISALPVVLDEIEADKQADRARIQAILDYARCCSTENGALISKATGGSSVAHFNARNMFAISSVYPGLFDATDKSRFAQCELLLDLSPARIANYETITAMTTSFQNPEYSARFIRRQIEQYEVILQHIKVCTAAVTDVFGNARAADQYGALLGGALSLLNSEPVSLEQARDYIQHMDWSEQKGDLEEDEVVMVIYLMLSYQVYDPDSKQKITIGTIFERAGRLHGYDSMLTENGFKRHGDIFFVSTNHAVPKMIASSLGLDKHLSRALHRHPAVISGHKSMRFNGMMHNTIGIDLSKVMVQGVPMYQSGELKLATINGKTSEEVSAAYADSFK